MTESSIDFDLLGLQLDALISDETDALANTANMIALLWQSLPNINWAGVYVLRDGELVLGPFQGNPACVRIPVGKGVCGTAASEKRTLRVADVDHFPGHIACDAASRSELVVPMICDGELLGVVDIDSPETGRFDERDQAGIELLVKRFLTGLRKNGAVKKPFI